MTIREVDGELVVLDRQAGLIHQLNRTASYIWNRCDGKTTVRELAVAMARTFDVDPNTAGADVVAAVAQLRELSLLEPHA